MRELRIMQARSVRWSLAVVAGLVCLALWPLVAPQAQHGEAPVNVTGVTTQKRGNDAVVSISGDSALTRAQTWQDEEGFHVVVYKGQNALRAGLPRGVKARRVGDSLEFVVPVKTGGSVYVQPRFDRLDVVVGGGLGAGAAADEQSGTRQSAHSDAAQQPTTRDAQAARRSVPAAEQGGETAAREARRQKTTADDSPQAGERKSAQSAHGGAQADTQHFANTGLSPQAQNMLPPSYQNGAPSPQSNQTAALAQQQTPVLTQQSQTDAQAAAAGQPPAPVLPVEAATVEPVSSTRIWPLTAVGLCFGGGLCAFLFIYRRQRRRASDGWEEIEPEETSTALARPAPKALSRVEMKAQEQNGASKLSANGLEPHPQGERRRDERRRNLGRRSSDQTQGMASTGEKPTADKQERRPSYTSTPAVVFGAYRIDQEVDKLLQGQPHSIEVLAARAPDDRRAVETSLLKALQSTMLGEDERRRARLALEEYGFVARQSATLLLASDTYERTMAARVLGQVRSAAALPFLLEALHDPEPIVSTEVVTSLGSLGLPSAIGALLDLARRHPELPAPLFARALSACSVDCIDVGTSYDAEGRMLTSGSFTGDIEGLEPVAEIEQLPEWLEDHTLAEALERLASADVEVRTHAAQQLAQFQVQRSVDALAALATIDPDATVRATAITSLGIIGHESVFAAVLIGTADEAREVRAAAARALSRLSFDRADAYVRVIESSDAAQMRRLAQACINAGLAAKALDRLASDDRRQAYEAFSLLSLVINAGEWEFVLNAVEQPGELNVRLAASRLLALQGQADVIKRLRLVALGNGTPEKLRSAILEAIYRDDHASVE